MAQMANTFQQFIQATTNNTQAINELHGTVNKMSTTLSTLEKGKFPAQPQPNPQVYRQQQHQVHNVSRDAVETAKAVLTLRSGKEVSRPEMTIDTEVIAPTPKDAAETDEAEKEPEVAKPKKPVSADAETSKGYQPVVPYPQRLAAGKSGVVKLTFGNMTLKLNIFNTCRQPQDLEEGTGHGVPWQPMFPKLPPWAAPIKPSSDDRHHLIGALRTLENSNLRCLANEHIQSKIFDPGKLRFRWSGPYIVNPREVF
ncbi:hypothetical protein I3843_03G122200 [Carya illinoinensis]|uniref:Uncharacterized protein n=1 Tax=Carya illinoinensis TaxID=32201 RepID=A0A922FGI4_CARIL|nr:hypothetical protein I3842_03G122400 [Carya illinoinensis]KAG7987207.1 hypothetical protein I3843_03G122200 [Carya illinoinensis]